MVGVAGPNTKILPGHGVVSSRADVIGFRDMVLDVSGQVEEMLESNLSYAQVAAADPTAAYNAQYGDPDRFLRALYTELGGEL